jgi:hypothetical protein
MRTRYIGSQRLSQRLVKTGTIQSVHWALAKQQDWFGELIGGTVIPHPSSKPATLARVTLLREQIGSAFTTETFDEFIRESIKKFPRPSLRPAGGVREGSPKLPVDPQLLQKDEHTNRSKTQTFDGPSYLPSRISHDVPLLRCDGHLG